MDDVIELAATTAWPFAQPLAVGGLSGAIKSPPARNEQFDQPLVILFI
jgi:hypothetical protein